MWLVAVCQTKIIPCTSSKELTRLFWGCEGKCEVLTASLYPRCRVERGSMLESDIEQFKNVDFIKHKTVRFFIKNYIFIQVEGFKVIQI